MSILINEIRICGFRGLENLSATLPKTAIVIGTNNSGKTSLIKAMQLALGDYSRYITDEDFFIDKNEKRASRIIVDIRIISVNADGQRQKLFADEWVQEFGDKIRSEADGNQFHAIRTLVRPDHAKGGFTVERHVLDEWPTFNAWQEAPTSPKAKFTKRYDLVPFISIDAQRDIHNELNNKTSFVGRVLSSIQYEDSDIQKLEKMIAEINEEAVEKSAPLKSLKQHLSSLNQSFGGTGNAEVTPFPKKMRDLSKRFSVHFGDSASNSFSMEYHGMGTRSWASMLAVKAFTDLMAQKHEEEAEPFFPILAAEEPEAHLHPNAQRSLFRQLVSSPGQVIISTHSPYLAAMCNLGSIRYLTKVENSATCLELIKGLSVEELNVLHREVLRHKGELLFAKAIILFEGATEEQIFPAMFEAYFGVSPFERGVTLMQVGGKNYPPFVKLAISFGIPTFIVSDNDKNTKKEIESQISKMEKLDGLKLGSGLFCAAFLSTGNDLEAELINELSLENEIIESLVNSETSDNDNSQYVTAKTAEISALGKDDLIERMRGKKTSYSSFLSEVVLRNPNDRPKGDLIPKALLAAFTQIEKWLANS